MIMIRNKIGDGSERFPYQPDMEGIVCNGWQIIEERENEFDVEIFGYKETKS